jgi:hypothetical protein
MNKAKVGAWRHTVQSECIIGLKICMDSKMWGFTYKYDLFICFSMFYISFKVARFAIPACF